MEVGDEMGMVVIRSHDAVAGLAEDFVGVNELEIRVEGVLGRQLVVNGDWYQAQRRHDSFHPFLFDDASLQSERRLMKQLAVLFDLPQIMIWFHGKFAFIAHARSFDGYKLESSSSRFQPEIPQLNFRCQEQFSVVEDLGSEH